MSAPPHVIPESPGCAGCILRSDRSESLPAGQRPRLAVTKCMDFAERTTSRNLHPDVIVRVRARPSVSTGQDRWLACDITGVNVVERGPPAFQRQSDRTYPAKRPSHELAAQDQNVYHPTSQASMPRCAKQLKGNACTFQTARLPVTLLVNRSSTRDHADTPTDPHFRIPVRCHGCQRLVWRTSNTPSQRAFATASCAPLATLSSQLQISASFAV